MDYELLKDKKNRPEVGMDSINKYEFGGFEIDNKLTNGYQLYIPYGLHIDFFKSIDYSIRLMKKAIDESEHKINVLLDSVKSNQISSDVGKDFINSHKYEIESLNQKVELLEKLSDISNEI